MSRNFITESLVLPSSAVHLYGPNFNGVLTLRAMTTDEERMRLSGQSFYGTMTKIVNECIVDNKNPDGTYKLDSAGFTEFDFFAICVKLRIMSYGPFYKTMAICTKCGKQFEYKADLTKLEYNLIPDDFTEPYNVGPLPSSGDTLGCRFLRIKDKIDIEEKKQLILAQNPKYIGDPAFNLEMERRIQTVNGKEYDYVEVEDYVHGMIAMDSVTYHENVDKNLFGVVRLNLCDCDEDDCDGKAMWLLKADSEFFRPYTDR